MWSIALHNCDILQTGLESCSQNSVRNRFLGHKNVFCIATSLQPYDTRFSSTTTIYRVQKHSITRGRIPTILLRLDIEYPGDIAEILVQIEDLSIVVGYLFRGACVHYRNQSKGVFNSQSSQLCGKGYRGVRKIFSKFAGFWSIYFCIFYSASTKKYTWSIFLNPNVNPLLG